MVLLMEAKMPDETPQNGQNQTDRPQGQTTPGPQTPTQGGPNPAVTPPELIIVQEGYSPKIEKKDKDSD
jgi:hypothetical protein